MNSTTTCSYSNPIEIGTNSQFASSTCETMVSNQTGTSTNMLGNYTYGESLIILFLLLIFVLNFFKVIADLMIGRRNLWDKKY